MLSPNYLYNCTNDISELYAALETEIINDISRRIAKVGKVTASAEWQILKAQEAGALYDSIIKKVALRTKQSEKVIRKLFEESAVKSLKFDDSVYKNAGLEPIPLMQSPAMLQTLAAGLMKTNGELRNLTMSTALTSRQTFLSAADMAYMKVTSGAFDYNTAIKQAVIEIAKKGVETIGTKTEMIGFAGRVDHIDVAVRRAVLTGVNQTAGKLTMSRISEMGTDLVETTAHRGARPAHQKWQGRVHSMSGAKGYPDFKETRYGFVDGLMGANCRHSFHPFIEGSTPTVDPEDYENQEVSFRGEKMDFYEATQRQRKYEREIRKWKRQKSALESAGLGNEEERIKIRDLQREAKAFSEATGVTRRPSNEQII